METARLYYQNQKQKRKRNCMCFIVSSFPVSKLSFTYIFYSLYLVIMKHCFDMSCELALQLVNEFKSAKYFEFISKRFSCFSIQEKEKQKNKYSRGNEEEEKETENKKTYGLWSMHYIVR